MPEDLDTLILVPGLARDAREEFGLVGTALSRRYRVHTLPPDDAQPDVGLLGRAVHDTATTMAGQGARVGVIAQGAGCGAALWAAGRADSVVSGLVLVSPWTAREPRSLMFLDLIARLANHPAERRQAFALAMLGPEWVEDAENRWSPEPSDVDGWLTPLARSAQIADLEVAAARVTARTLVVTGNHDQLGGARFGRLLAATIPDARLEPLPTGHLIVAERPVAVTALMEDHFRSCSRVRKNGEPVRGGGRER